MTRLFSSFILIISFSLSVFLTSARAANPTLNQVFTGGVSSFLEQYQKDLAKLKTQAALASWNALVTGKKADFALDAKAQLADAKYHSDKNRFKQVEVLLKAKMSLSPKEARQIELARLAFKSNQLPDATLKKMVDLSKEIEEIFNNDRAKIDKKEYTNNEILEKLAAERNGGKREVLWKGLKQVGSKVAPKLINLAVIRNAAAKDLGYENYWDMMVRLQEYEPNELLAIFAELEKVTNKPFAEMKTRLDAELGRRFNVKPEEMMPWHYDNPFFQAPSPSEKFDPDEFYSKKKKEDIVGIGKAFFTDIGFPVEDILARSDLYEKKGKSQHAFSVSIDRADDVRTLLNIKPNANWMGTLLHELGHAIYSKNFDRTLPYSLRDENHIFTTEGIAIMLESLSQQPEWLVAYAGVDPKRVESLREALLEQRRRELLIFARWTMVMLNFEKAFYENPAQDLNKLWWDHVEKYQLLKRPSNRNEPDWASKPHFTIAPVYYHNYMLGYVFAAQLKHALANLAGYKGKTVGLSFNGRKDFGNFLREKVFQPGKAVIWSRFVKDVTGENLTPKYFAMELE